MEFAMIKTGLMSFALVLAVTAPAVATTDPKAAYDELCLACHKQPQRLAARLANTDEARAKLDAFLVKHYAPDADKRAAVVKFMYSLK
jgi:cytochrome c5